MWIDPEQLQNFLADSGLATKPELEKFATEAKKSKKSFEDVVLASGRISEDDLRRTKAYILGIPFVDLKKNQIDKDTLYIIPEPIARKHNLVAFNKHDGVLEVAMLDPDDLAAIDFVKKGSGLKLWPRLTDAASIKSALLQYQKSLKAEFGDLVGSEAAKLKTLSTGEDEEVDESKLAQMAEDLPVVRIVDTLLSHAITQQASDIHIENFEKEVIIRYRIDGLLHDAMVLPKNAGPGIIARIKVLSNLRLDEKRLPQDGRFKIELNGSGVSFRVSVLPTYFGEKIVMRLLPDAGKGLSLESGGFHGEGLERVQRATQQANGMILVTGPTGSGKSTTLYTILEILNQPDVNISTIEDPIEYQMPRVNQTQVKAEIGLTFGSGLRSLVRQDPDIIMVGEIRDKETAGLAINAALTGHLVLSTLHTNSAAGTVPRLLDMGAEPFLLVSTINVIIAQRLVRRLESGAEKYTLTAAELKKLGQTVDLEEVLKVLKEEKIVAANADWSSIPFYRAKKNGSSDGYAGRIGIHEVLTVTPTIKDLVIKGSTSAAIEAQARKEGMLTMLEDGIYQCVRGVTSIEEVLRVISE